MNDPMQALHDIQTNLVFFGVPLALNKELRPCRLVLDCYDIAATISRLRGEFHGEPEGFEDAGNQLLFARSLLIADRRHIRRSIGS